MELASLIISVLALIIGLASLSWQIAKAFSTHTIQYVDPFKGMDGGKIELGKGQDKEFREIGEPLDDDELSYLEEAKKKRLAK